MKKIIEKFEVDYLQILNESGVVDESLMPKISVSDIKKIYELMVLTRTFDEKAINLQRQGRIGTYASVKGEEACQVASAILMQESDIAFPSFREHGVYLTRGAPPEKLYMYWGGDEQGMATPKEVNVFPVSIPIATQAVHAVGAAMGFQYLKKKSVALAYFSDGATSEGDFHEAMNFAGEFKAPVIFLCQNNQWAISTPVKEQTASETIAQKAIAYGFEGIRVDGNDIFAVYSEAKKAIEKARAEKGPTFIECFTYRLGDHTTSDDSTKYRSQKEVQEWIKKDPILRLQKYILSKKIANQSYINSTQKNAEKIIEQAVKKYESTPLAPAETIFDYTYSSLTPELKEQKEKFLSEIKSVQQSNS